MRSRPLNSELFQQKTHLMGPLLTFLPISKEDRGQEQGNRNSTSREHSRQEGGTGIQQAENTADRRGEQEFNNKQRTQRTGGGNRNSTSREHGGQEGET